MSPRVEPVAQLLALAAVAGVSVALQEYARADAWKIGFALVTITGLVAFRSAWGRQQGGNLLELTRAVFVASPVAMTVQGALGLLVAPLPSPPHAWSIANLVLCVLAARIGRAVWSRLHLVGAFDPSVLGETSGPMAGRVVIRSPVGFAVGVILTLVGTFLWLHAHDAGAEPAGVLLGWVAPGVCFTFGVVLTSVGISTDPS